MITLHSAALPNEMAHCWRGSSTPPAAAEVSTSKERRGGLSEHPLPGEDRLQRHCVVCGENRVQLALVQDGHHGALAAPEETGQGSTHLRLNYLAMMQPQQLPDA